MNASDIQFVQRHTMQLDEGKPCHYCNPAEGAIHRRVDGLRCLLVEAGRAPVRCLSCSHSRKLYNSVARLTSLCHEFQSHESQEDGKAPRPGCRNAVRSRTNIAIGRTGYWDDLACAMLKTLERAGRVQTAPDGETLPRSLVRLGKRLCVLFHIMLSLSAPCLQPFHLYAFSMSRSNGYPI